MKEKYSCPVCGFKGLDVPPYDEELVASYETCHCCGVEIGYDDFKFNNISFDVARNKWLSGGAKWFKENYKPKNWCLKEQLKNTQLSEIKNLEKELQIKYDKHN